MSKLGCGASDSHCNHNALDATQWGVYHVLTKTQKPFYMDPVYHVKSALQALSICIRLTLEVYALSPTVFILYILTSLWESLESVVLLSMEARILRVIEHGLKTGQVDVEGIVKAVVTRLICVVAAGVIGRWTLTLQNLIENRVIHHHDHFILRSRLKKDLADANDSADGDRVNGKSAWHAFEAFVDLVEDLCSVVGQLAFVFRIARKGNHGSMYALLCLGKPLVTLLRPATLWSTPRVVSVNNAAYLRLRAVKEMADKKYRADVISTNISDYIHTEYQKARNALGDISFDLPEIQSYQSHTNSPMRRATEDILYYATIAIFYPSSLTITTIAILQRSSYLLRSTFQRMLLYINQLNRYCGEVRQIYDLPLKNQSTSLRDGSLSYPPRSDKLDAGMGFELRNVSFAYPGSQSSQALKGISLSIKPGQLVVLVGSNGSGKSTVIKLLSRLYDPDGGQILVDGHDIRQYKMADLRRSTATLTQDHNLFPLSLRENIGLGNIERLDEEQAILEAARLGEASSLVAKMQNGLDTVLDPCSVNYGVRVNDPGNESLLTEYERLSKVGTVSGGERQRLVAARTFMRFQTNQVKFVAVDEPTSALDAEGEQGLFENLRAMQKGKTMVFVTHRFGHLTVHADLILCMKDGRLEESGTHKELMTKQGEYYKLYNIQANAFRTED